MRRRDFFRHTALSTAAAVLARHALGAESAERPNILWLSTEDIGPHLGCYGDPLAKTPNLDALVAEGVRYSHAFTVAPVCAANRSSIITGVHSSTLGTMHMRSGGEGVARSVQPEIPDHIRCFSAYLRDAGYYCTNNSKQDYNFDAPKDSWDKSSNDAHWKDRAEGQPFFAVFNYTGTHEGSARAEAGEDSRPDRLPEHIEATDPAAVNVPPYHVDTPLVRKNWARYYDNIAAMDHWVGEHLKALDEAGLRDNTIIMFWSDHGAGLPRGKRWVYDSGTRIPLILHVPERWRDAFPATPDSIDDQLVSSIDFAPTVLRMAGLDAPDHMQGRVFVGSEDPERMHIFAHRDRMDERYDCIRMARNSRWMYVRNYMPFKPYDQYLNTGNKSPVKQELLAAAEAGELPEGAQWIVKESKPVEELYDCEADPFQVNSVIDDPANAAVLKELRAAMDAWRDETNDLGLIPEPELVNYETRFGTRYAALPALEKLYPDFVETLNGVARFAGKPSAKEAEGLPLDHDEAAIRYWCVVGLGQLDNTREPVEAALEDEAPVVRVAAAKACLDHGWVEEKALDLLINELASNAEWVRLHAATALDEIGEKARPAVDALKDALRDRDNKYVVRVANRALNQLEGTSREVR